MPRHTSRSRDAIETQAKAQSHQRSMPRDKDATRQRILDAAETVFSEKGYHGAIVDDIAEVAQTSKGGFYFHFPNKQTIFLALIDSLTPRLATAVDHAISDESDPIAKIDAALRTVLDMFARHRRLSKILLVESIGLGHEFDERIMYVRWRFIELIQRYLDEAVELQAIPAINTSIAATAWFGAINEIVVRWLVTGNPSQLEGVLPDLRRLLLQSVGISPSASQTTNDH